jgi:hypothetical protein
LPSWENILVYRPHQFRKAIHCIIIHGHVGYGYDGSFCQGSIRSN